MNNTKSVKYGLEPEVIEKECLQNENFKERYDFHRLNQIPKASQRYKRHDIKIDFKRKKKLRELLVIGEHVLILAHRLKKKMLLYKSTTESKPFFSKKQIYIVRKVVEVSKTFNYWISKEGEERIIPGRFFRELFAIKNQFK